MNFRPTQVVIDLVSLKANFQEMRKRAEPGAMICPMVKANAYGHGDVGVARALRAAGATDLGVALIEEGEKLRASGDQGSILVFSIFEDAPSAEACVQNRLTSVSSTFAQLEALEKAALKLGRTQVAVHVEFNTGMNRLGFSTNDAKKIREFFECSKALRLEGVCTHLLRSDDTGLPGGFSESQLLRFNEALGAFHGMKIRVHVLNSGGIAALSGRGLEPKKILERLSEFGPLGTRPGISLYGAQASDERALKLNLQPVLSWRSKIIAVNQVAKGERVSYNATWKAERPSLIGVVAVGYADGYSRALSNRGSVLVRGMRAPVAGIVCMDYFMVDLTDIVQKTGEIHSGEDVVLIGRQGSEEITVEEMANARGTITYEVLTNISARVPRAYADSEAK